MPNKMSAEASDDNCRSTQCGIVRHSTLRLSPVLVGQFEFLEWTPDDHCGTRASLACPKIKSRRL